MKKIIFSLIAFVSLTINAQTTWKVDNAHSSITFSVSHFMISEVTGNFGKFDIQQLVMISLKTQSLKYP